MKILKFLLVVFLLFLMVALGSIVFSNRIISYMTETKHSKFENLKYSIKESEITFDNFRLNGKSLGRGKAKVNFSGTGLFKLTPKLELSSLKLENVDLKTLSAVPDEKLDGFINKIHPPLNEEAVKKTTEEFVKETTDRLKKADTAAKDFRNNKIMEDVKAVNTIKTDYASLTDLKLKSGKLDELNKKTAPLIRSINIEKENLQREVSHVEAERSIMFSNISSELTKLERAVSLNDIENINSYILLDRGREISDSLRKSLKTVNLIEEIKALPLSISGVEINNGDVKFENLDKDESLKGEILMDNNLKAAVKMLNGSYEIDYKNNDLSIRTLMGERIHSLVEYLKSGILEGKQVKLVSELIFENNDLKSVNKTVLSEEEKVQLSQKISNMKETSYKEIMTKYEEQLKSIESLIQAVYEERNKLDKLQQDILSLNTIVPLDGTSAQGDPLPAQNSTENVNSKENQQGPQGPDKAAETVNQIKEALTGR